MYGMLTALNPQELVILLIAIAGLVPIIVAGRSVSTWLILAYGFLLLGAFATNLENLFWHDPINFLEHSVGNLGAGLAVAVFAWSHYRGELADPVGEEDVG